MAPAKKYAVVPGSERAAFPGARLIGKADPDERIEVTLYLRARSTGKTLASADELGKLRPRERTHLSREEFAGIYGSDPADIAKIERFAHEHGLTIISVNAPQRTVELAGTVSSLSQAFNVELSKYEHPGGTYRGRSGPVHVPAELEGVVEGVFGLDNRPQAKPHFRRMNEQGGAWHHAASVSYTPLQLAHLYDFPTNLNGQGQCIAIIELGGGYTADDLNTYFQNLGLPTPNVTAYSVGGGQNSPTGDPNGPDGEVMLDIEVAGAIAPQAQIVVYFAPNTDQGFLQAVNTAIHDNLHNPSVVSISWGGPESSWTRQSLNAFNQAFQAGTTMGVTVCVAAGDGGSSDGVAGRLAHVDFPASSPYALACGGTSLQSSQSTITSETVWNDGPSGGAGGGGVSDFFPLPAWQANAHVPHSVNPGHHVGRGLPDVAGDADPATGYQVRIDGTDTVIGGTSAVAPLWAGLISLFNQKLGKSVGYLNPLLYSQAASTPAAFHDITQGNNDMTGKIGGYNAGKGWDACTGLGSPDGTNLMAVLA
jgi:kumamolisin